MRAILVAGFLAATASVVSAQAPERSLELQFHEDGTVTLSARNVTTSEILRTWATECKCVVVNGSLVSGPPMATPMLFEHAAQAVVLRSLLKQTGGYVLTPQRPGAVGPSQYETIYILPTGGTMPAPSMAGGLGGAIPGPIQPAQNPTAGAPDDEIPPVTPIRIPEPIDPERNSTPEPSGPSPNPPTPGVSLPGVRVVPITPIGPSASPASQPTPPGGVTPARNP